jgi:ribokinase
MSATPRIVVIGSANTDMMVRVATLPIPGQTVVGMGFAVSQGGKGANQAVAAARLGATVTFVTRLGRDAFGQAAEAAYQREGLDLKYLVWDEEAASGVALILVDEGGENIIAVAPGANFCLSPGDVRAGEEAIRAADCVLLQLEIPIECVETAIALARKHGKRVVLNPAPVGQLAPALLQEVDILTPNETEFAALSGVTTRSLLRDQDAAGDFRLRHGIRNLVITMGSQGALIVGENHTNLVPAFKVQAVDTTGAGDAFNGGLAVALARGEDLERAVRFANAVGALSVAAAGAQSSLPTREQVERLLESGAVEQPKA